MRSNFVGIRRNSTYFRLGFVEINWGNVFPLNSTLLQITTARLVAKIEMINTARVTNETFDRETCAPQPPRLFALILQLHNALAGCARTRECL